MPFNSETKARMFIKSGRLCCLCLKQCGSNMEAAHIIDEYRGGSNDEDNGIPTCFDCHQEIGAYNPKHPKGNKFTPEELKARRDRIYTLVETGVIYAQVVATQIRKNFTEGPIIILPVTPSRPAESEDARSFTRMLISRGESIETPARKLQLFAENDRAYVLDELLRQVPGTKTALPVLAMIASSELTSVQERCVILESISRKVSIFGDLDDKIALLRSVPETLLLAASEEVRSSLFDELIMIVNRDQYDEVNKLVPALVNHAIDVPTELRGDYIISLLLQTQSNSFHGAPSAKSCLRRLPREFVKDGIHKIDKDFLYWRARIKDIKNFIEQHIDLVDGEHKQLFMDFLSLSYMEFASKYNPVDD